MDTELKQDKIQYEREWCAYEIKWIETGGPSEYSIDYLKGFIAGLDFMTEEEGK